MDPIARQPGNTDDQQQDRREQNRVVGDGLTRLIQALEGSSGHKDLLAAGLERAPRWCSGQRTRSTKA